MLNRGKKQFSFCLIFKFGRPKNCAVIALSQLCKP